MHLLPCKLNLNLKNTTGRHASVKRFFPCVFPDFFKLVWVGLGYTIQKFK